jgi:hypothetical protein
MYFVVLCLCTYNFLFLQYLFLIFNSWIPIYSANSKLYVPYYAKLSITQTLISTLYFQLSLCKPLKKHPIPIKPS